MPQSLDHMLEDKNITRPLYLVAHGFITGQYAVTWALAHPEAVAKLVIMDVPLSPEARRRCFSTNHPLWTIRPGGGETNAPECS